MEKEIFEINMTAEDYSCIPTKNNNTDIGYDLKANITENIIIHPGERHLIPTGVKLELPENCYALITPRSGLALKNGITVLNTPGLIDPDYRGEIKVILINHGHEYFTVTPQMRIAQMILNATSNFELRLKENIDESTQRGSKGFGSSGV